MLSSRGLRSDVDRLIQGSSIGGFLSCQDVILAVSQVYGSG